MRLAIMQPYFFPYLGYISLIKHSNMFILLDVVQFIRHGWIERNRILHPSEGWQYIRVPMMRHHREISICDIRIDNEQAWKKKALDQLQHYRKVAPYYHQVTSLLKDIFSNDYEGIVSLNGAALEGICHYLNIKTEIKVFSEMGLILDPVTAPDEWALNICKAIPDATEYWNPPGGIDLFDRTKYEANQIQIKFQKVRLKEYNQGRASFEPGLSILDVMMFNGVDQINKMLDDYELL